MPAGAVEIRPEEPPKVTGRTAFRGAVLTSAWTLLSRVLGFARDALMAASLGISPVYGAFSLAWILPNLFRRLFGEGAASAAIQPALARERERRGPDGEAALFARFHGFLVLALLALLLGGEAAFQLALRALPAEAAPATRQAVVLGALLFPYAVPICLAALYAAPQNLRGMYGLPALAPACLNVVWIAALVAVSRLPGHPSYGTVAWLCLGILAGGLGQWLLQLAGLRAAGLPVRPAFRPGDGTVRLTLRSFLPALLGLAAFQINLAVDQVLVRALVDEAANAYTYLANRLLQLPLALVGIAAATGTAPLFARLSAEGRFAELTWALRRTCEVALLVTLMAAAGLYVLAPQVVSVLFEHGRFGAENSDVLVATLRAYLWSLPGATLAGLLTRARQSRGDYRGPAWCAAAALPLNLGLDLALLPVLGVPGAGYATAAALSAQAVLLGVGLAGLEIGSPLRSGTLARILLPAGLVAGAAAGAVALLGGASATVPGLAVAVAAGLAAGGAATAAVLPGDYREMRRILARRPGRA